MYHALGKKWRKFLNEVRKNAEKNDINQINIETLISLLTKNSFHMEEADKELLLDVFPGEDEGQRKLVNVNSLYTMRK